MTSKRDAGSEREDFDPATADRYRYVTDADEVEEGDRIIVDVDGREIAIFNVDGEYFALLNFCVHQGGPLCEGSVAGILDVEEESWELKYDRADEVVACPWHGWEFDITTGEHVAETDYKVPSYEVAEKDGKIYVKG
jgi:nitrite reductase/ring-hydroxylating ferredoxin subunit